MNRKKGESGTSFESGFLSAEQVVAVPGLFYQECLPEKRQEASALPVRHGKNDRKIRFRRFSEQQTSTYGE